MDYQFDTSKYTLVDGPVRCAECGYLKPKGPDLKRIIKMAADAYAFRTKGMKLEEAEQGIWLQNYDQLWGQWSDALNNLTPEDVQFLEKALKEDN